MIGESAPNFTLKNTLKEDVSLTDYAGKNVILAFYPGAFTGVCDTEMCSFQDNFSKLNESNSTVIGISVDSKDSHESFCNRESLNLLLLTDKESKLFELLSGLKKEVDLKIEQNTQILENESYVNQMITRIIIEEFNTKNNISLTADSAKNINNLLVKEYMKEYRGEAA